VDNESDDLRLDKPHYETYWSPPLPRLSDGEVGAVGCAVDCVVCVPSPVWCGGAADVGG
jgi:hypothetical protein